MNETLFNILFLSLEAAKIIVWTGVIYIYFLSRRWLLFFLFSSLVFPYIYVVGRFLLYGN